MKSPDEITEVSNKLAIPIGDIPITGNTVKMLLNTPTIPARYKQSQTGFQDMMAVMLTGREMGFGPLTSLYEIYLVNGQAGLSGKAMLALVWRAGHKVTIDIEETGSTVHCWRRFDDVLEHVGDVTFTVEDAATAGLLDKDTYISYPKTMLTWRAVSMACRLYYSDVILGVGYVPEELGVEAQMDEIPEGVIVDGDNLLEMDRAVIRAEEILDAEVVDESDVNVFALLTDLEVAAEQGAQEELEVE